MSNVYIDNIDSYNEDAIFELLPDSLFNLIKPGNKVVLKPNWVLENHQEKISEWEQVITHPMVTTAVLRKVVQKLGDKGYIIITDGPELNANFDKILALHPLNYWKKLTDEKHIDLKIIDLRDELYIQDKNVTIKKIPLPGDPNGKVIINLFDDQSEFYNHKKSPKGYFSGGSNIEEANMAHNGTTNLYSVSKSVLSSDVFINIPKLKTHKKSGITCCLKNLVGVNTNRNLLPHNSIGTPSEGGDQFPDSKNISKLESALMPFIHQNILTKPLLSRFFSPLMFIGKKIFGDNKTTIRGGSWYGNDTIWRMIIDLNKILLYSNPEGTMSIDKRKYIAVVDAIIAGEGNGPKSPDLVNLNKIIVGDNPVNIDAVCARIMGFDPHKIPSINRSFNIKHFPIADVDLEEINVLYNKKSYYLSNLPIECITNCKPHPGWVGHIEN